MPVDPLSLRIYLKDLPIPITVKLPSIYFNSDTGVSSYNLNSKFLSPDDHFYLESQLETDAKNVKNRCLNNWI